MCHIYGLAWVNNFRVLLLCVQCEISPILNYIFFSFSLLWMPPQQYEKFRLMMYTNKFGYKKLVYYIVYAPTSSFTVRNINCMYFLEFLLNVVYGICKQLTSRMVSKLSSVFPSIRKLMHSHPLKNVSTFTFWMGFQGLLIIWVSRFYMPYGILMY